MARVWRRRQFAAPFVMVLGCGQPTDRGATTPPPPTTTHPEIESQQDPTTVRPDAATTVFRPTPPDAHRPGKCELDPRAPGCNPPPPTTPSVDAPIMGVIGVTAEGYDFAVAAGTARIRRPVRGEFIDDETKQPLDGTSFKVVKASTGTTIGRLPPSFTALPSHRVRLYGELEESR